MFNNYRYYKQEVIYDELAFFEANTEKQSAKNWACIFSRYSVLQVRYQQHEATNLYHCHINIVWPTFYVNNGDVTTFRARYFNSFHKNELSKYSRKTDVQIENVNTIICAVKY